MAQRGRRTGQTTRQQTAAHRASDPSIPDANDAPTAVMPVVPLDGAGPEPGPKNRSAKDLKIPKDPKNNAEPERPRAIPEASVARLAVYLRVLSGLAEHGATTVSSDELAAAAGVNSAKLRKDLSYLGSYGTRGVGYDVAVLVGHLERTLGLTRQQKVAVVGIGNLGHALANYGGFPGRGFPVEALFDVDPDLIGVPVGGLPVSHLDEIPMICAQRRISIGIIATPPTAAQLVCDRLVAGGVRSILNFAPVVLQVPEHIEVRKVDLAVELQILSFHAAHQAERALSGTAPGGNATQDGAVAVPSGDGRARGGNR